MLLVSQTTQLRVVGWLMKIMKWSEFGRHGRSQIEGRSRKSSWWNETPRDSRCPDHKWKKKHYRYINPFGDTNVVSCVSDYHGVMKIDIKITTSSIRALHSITKTRSTRYSKTPGWWLRFQPWPCLYLLFCTNLITHFKNRKHNHQNYEERALFKSNLFRVVLDQRFPSFFSSRATVTIQNMYTYHCLLYILMPTFRILVLQDVLPWKPQILQLLLF